MTRLAFAMLLFPSLARALSPKAQEQSSDADDSRQRREAFYRCE